LILDAELVRLALEEWLVHAVTAHGSGRGRAGKVRRDVEIGLGEVGHEEVGRDLHGLLGSTAHGGDADEEQRANAYAYAQVQAGHGTACHRIGEGGQAGVSSGILGSMGRRSSGLMPVERLGMDKAVPARVRIAFQPKWRARWRGSQWGQFPSCTPGV